MNEKVILFSMIAIIVALGTFSVLVNNNGSLTGNVVQDKSIFNYESDSFNGEAPYLIEVNFIPKKDIRFGDPTSLIVNINMQTYTNINSINIFVDEIYKKSCFFSLTSQEKKFVCQLDPEIFSKGVHNYRIELLDWQFKKSEKYGEFVVFKY